MQLDPRRTYEVILELGTVQFTHHPCFSKEHVLTSRLEEAYADYATRNVVRLTDRATNRIKALREAILHSKQTYKGLLEQLESATPSAEKKKIRETLKSLQERMRGYRVEIQRTSLERDQGYWDDRSALVSVLELWRELKALRREQGYVNTTLKLSIMEIPVDIKDDKLAWQRAVEEEFNDLKEEFDENFEFEMTRYQEELRKWEGGGGSKTQRRRPSTSKDESDEETVTDDTSAKPTPPQKFDPEGTMRAIEKRFEITQIYEFSRSLSVILFTPIL